MAHLDLFQSQYVNFGSCVQTIIKEYNNEFSSILNTNPVIVYPEKVFYFNKPEITEEQIHRLTDACKFDEFFLMLNKCGFQIKLIAYDFITDVLERYNVFPNIGYKYENLSKIKDALEDEDYNKYFSIIFFLDHVSIEYKSPISLILYGIKFEEADLDNIIENIIPKKFPFTLNSESYYKSFSDLTNTLCGYSLNLSRVSLEQFKKQEKFHFTLPNSITSEKIRNLQYGYVESILSEIINHISYNNSNEKIFDYNVCSYYAGHDMKDYLMYRFLTDERGNKQFEDFLNIK